MSRITPIENTTPEEVIYKDKQDSQNLKKLNDELQKILEKKTSRHEYKVSFGHQA